MANHNTIITLHLTKLPVAGTHLVLVGILRCGAMGGLKNGMAALVVDVATRGNANTANLGSQSIRQVVAVEVHGGNDVEVLGASKHLKVEAIQEGRKQSIRRVDNSR